MDKSILQLFKLTAVWGECNRVEQIVCTGAMHPCEPGLCVLDERVCPCRVCHLQGHLPAAELVPAILSCRTGIWTVNNVIVKTTALSRGHWHLENEEVGTQPKMLFFGGTTCQGTVLAWNITPEELLSRAEDVAVRLNECVWVWDSLLAAGVCASPLQVRTCPLGTTANGLPKCGVLPRVSLARTSWKQKHAVRTDFNLDFSSLDWQ